MITTKQKSRAEIRNMKKKKEREKKVIENHQTKISDRTQEKGNDR